MSERERRPTNGKQHWRQVVREWQISHAPRRLLASRSSENVGHQSECPCRCDRIHDWQCFDIWRSLWWHFGNDQSARRRNSQSNPIIRLFDYKLHIIGSRQTSTVAIASSPVQRTGRSFFGTRKNWLKRRRHRSKVSERTGDTNQREVSPL